MADWSVWESAYGRLTLDRDGDINEQSAADWLAVDFPNYEKFWRYHVAPATKRPVDTDHRPEADRVVCQMMTLSYSIFLDLMYCRHRLDRLRGGDFGDRNEIFVDCVKYAGDALQKFSDLQEVIEGPFSKRLGTKVVVWSKEDWKKIWAPRREAVVSYRNYVTHVAGGPLAIFTADSSGRQVPTVIKRDHIVRGNYPTWNEQNRLRDSNPDSFDSVVTIGQTLYGETAIWLNDTYGELRKAMDPLLPSHHYHWLWGWDRGMYGSGTGSAYPIGLGPEE